MPARPAPASVPVGCARVNGRVFGRFCVRGHTKPGLNEGRAGPGDAGGVGWAAMGIELETREGVMAVGERIPDALLRRRREAARDVVDRVRSRRLGTPGAPGHAAGAAQA